MEGRYIEELRDELTRLLRKQTEALNHEPLAAQPTPTSLNTRFAKK